MGLGRGGGVVEESISPRTPMKRLKGQCGSFLGTHNWHYNIILGYAL